MGSTAAFDPFAVHEDAFLVDAKKSKSSDFSRELSSVFPSTICDNTITDEFGFPANCFPAEFESGNVFRQRAAERQSTDVPATIHVAETMCVLHQIETNECSVKVCGNISV